MSDDPLSSVEENQRPEPNVFGSSLECQICGESVREGYYNAREQILVWWCSKDHESIIEEFKL